MKPIVLGIAVALAVLATGYLFIATPAIAPLSEEVGQTYANDTYGLSFTYPDGYVLSEGEVTDGLYVIQLIREEDSVPVVAGGEGPTALTIEIIRVADEFTLDDWLKAPTSNFQISDGTYTSRMTAGISSIHYNWSGLYEGETVALLHEDTVVALSVTYHSPTDPIRAAYDEVLTSLRLR